jgi:hypothetical protein
MKPESHPMTELIAARTRQLRLLAADLLESRSALVRLDLEAIYQHNAQQQTLYQEVQRLDGQIMRFADVRSTAAGGRTLSLDAAASGWDEEAQGQLRVLLEEHEAARDEVHDLSEVQADLLRRSRRYLRILSNLVNSSMGVYEAPKFRPVFPGAGRGN